jgi:hypothetical protein
VLITRSNAALRECVRQHQDQARKVNDRAW